MKYLSLFFYYIYIKNMIHNSQISLFLLILLLNNLLLFMYNVSYFIRRRGQSRLEKN